MQNFIFRDLTIYMKFHFLLLTLFIILFSACSTKPLEPVKFEELNKNISFENEIKPLLDKRCVSCHSCYNSPCQLKLSSFEGLQRGSTKKNIYENSSYKYFITTLNEENIPIKYIVIESCQVVNDKNSIRILILIKLIVSSIFIACVGYLLSKILLNPARKRVDSMDKFIKDSAHELNTPISVLMTSVSMLKNGKNPEKMMKYILSSSKQISQIYNDIHFSAFNEINEDVFEEFDLKDLVSESVDYFNDISITKNIQINSNLFGCCIKMDRTKTQKLVNNLISNAIKYSYKDSIIEVTLKDNILSVKDFGRGISEEEQKEIFKRYKRGNNNEGGFGIGLDIVKRICNEYNLILNLKSQINKETIFSIDFSSIVNKK